MNNCTVDASGNRTFSMRAHRTLGITIGTLWILAAAQAAVADNTARAQLTVWADSSCTSATCSEAQMTVTLNADCSSLVTCTVTATEDIVTDCSLFPSGFSSLTLYNNQTDTCTGTGTEPPYPVNLLAGPFTLSFAQWQDIFTVDHLIVGQAAGGSATASGNPRKASSKVPTIPEWGVVIMVGLLLTAGTVVFRRSQPKPA